MQDASALSLSLALVMLVFTFISGFFLWYWHIEQMSVQSSQVQQKSRASITTLMAYTLELERMLQTVTPEIFQQTLAARELTEQEIALLIRRFSAMLVDLQQIIDVSGHLSNKPAPSVVVNLKNSAEQIRKEIDQVLEALQFQDRVSQILNQVENNLISLKRTVERIQAQGSERHKSLLKVEEMLAVIQRNYESVNQLPKRLTNENEADELTFF
jgi:isoleucyl-tRNA synthetase